MWFERRRLTSGFSGDAKRELDNAIFCGRTLPRMMWDDVKKTLARSNKLARGASS